MMRTPPGIREKDLIVGRGYLVKSGQATMIQVASPYEGMGIPPAGGDAEDEAARTAKALDVWVQRIKDKYPGQQAVWSTGASSAQQAKTPQQSEKLRKRSVASASPTRGVNQARRWRRYGRSRDDQTGSNRCGSLAG